MHVQNYIPILRQPATDFRIALYRAAVAGERDLGLQCQHPIQRSDIVQWPARLGSPQSVEVRKRLIIIVTDEGGLVLRYPDGQVIGRFSGDVIDLEANATQNKLIFVVEQDLGLNGAVCFAAAKRVLERSKPNWAALRVAKKLPNRV